MRDILRDKTEAGVTANLFEIHRADADLIVSWKVDSNLIISESFKIVLPSKKDGVSPLNFTNVFVLSLLYLNVSVESSNTLEKSILDTSDVVNIT